MKKLLTLFALLAVFMGAKAESVIDYSIDYSTYGGFPFWVMGFVPEFDNGHMTDYGAMYTYKAEADVTDEDNVVGTVYTQGGALYNKVALREPAWHQYHLADGIRTEIDEKYVVKAKVRASEPVTINVNMGWGWGGGQSIGASVAIPQSDDFIEVEWEYTGIGGTSCNLVAQPGSCTAVIEWKSLTVSHYVKSGRPTEWIENILNGNAEKSWEEMDLANVTYNDEDNFYKVCAWAKEAGHNINEYATWAPFPATIENVDGNNVFVVHAQQTISEGDASSWDNQFWIQSPKAWKTGDQLKIHFRYKASRSANTRTQFHAGPDKYLHYQAIGDIRFDTDWQVYDETITLPENANGASSIAFCLNPDVKEATDFYFADLSWQSMKLDEGYFVAGANPNDGLEYDLDNAIQFEEGEDWDGGPCLVATVGERDAYVSQIMISTVRGNDAAYKNNTLGIDGSVTMDNLKETWFTYTAQSLAKINLPASGIWKVYLDPDYTSVGFELIEGTAVKLDDIVTNTTEVVVKGKEREYTEAEAEAAGIETPENPGYAWDNQLYIKANRALAKGEVTKLVFQYRSSVDYAKTTTLCHGAPGAYLHWSAIGDVNFTTDWQYFEREFIVPAEADGMQTLCFNMAEIKEACDYYIKDVQWYLPADEEGKTYENLIDGEGTENFYVKEGAGTAPYIYNNVPEPQPQDPEQGNLEMVYNIDYSTYGGFPFFVMSYVPEFDNGHMTDYGAMYTYKAEADVTDEDNVVGTVYTQGGALYNKVALREPAWHQYHLADGIRTEIDEKYVVKAKVRASEPVTINVNMAWSWSDNPISASVYIPDEWAEVEWEYSGIGGTQCWLVAQPGVSTATIEWASLAVYKYQNGQQQPVEWIEMLTNGDAETPWEEMGLADVRWNDEANNYKVSAWGRVKGENIDYDTLLDKENWCPFPATIEVDPDSVSNHIFVVHASYADSMDEYGDASAWDNQFWIQSPQEWKTGDQVKIHFRYKASQNARTSTQVHKQAPMEYLTWHAIGDVNFTTEWQEFDDILTIGEDMSGTWSIAFNLNVEVKDPTDFYFDDLSWQAMKLEEGWFVAGANLNSGLEYDCSNATEFVYDEGMECYTATIGELGKQETWVNQLMVSTVRGDNQAFKGHTIKIDGTVTGDPDHWFTYTEASNAKIKLPAEGVWQVYIYPEDKVISFAMLEGIIIDPLEVIPNPAVVTVYAQERDDLADTVAGDGSIIIREDEGGTGYAWDNQFFIVANRPLRAGESTLISFRYKSSIPSWASTFCNKDVYEYLHWAAIGSVYFDTEWQEFEKTFTIPEEADGMQTLAFNMAEIKEACNYQITDVVWMTEDMTETLIDTEGIKNFWVKEGAGTNPREFDPYYVPQETLMGDVDGSGQVNVTDVVMIIDNILGKTSWNFNAEVADVNYDSYINVTDVVMVIDHILGKVNLNRAAAADAEMGAISLSTDMTTVSLTNPSAYTAFQMDVTLPMGVSLEDVLLTERAAGSHSVVISKMDDGSYRIIGVSMQNKAFKDNAGDLLKLQLAGNAQGAVAINNVLFVTPQGVQHELAGVNAFGDVTGIANVNGNKEVTGNVFDLQGRQMNNAQLKKGLYILNGKKQIVK